MKLRTLVLGAAAVFLLAAFSGCKPRSENAVPPHVDWVVRSKVAFYASDVRTRLPTPKDPLRLWVPYVVGDIYGDANAGELAPVKLNPDLTFTIDLNLRYTRLADALVRTKFSEKWMSIEPAEARVARVSPFVLEKDGIAPLGRSEWLDTDTHTRLMLIYLDRPARIRGEIVHQGRNLRFDIDAREAGYVWVSQPEDSGVYRSVPQPANLELAVIPNS